MSLIASDSSMMSDSESKVSGSLKSAIGESVLLLKSAIGESVLLDCVVESMEDESICFWNVAAVAFSYAVHH